MLDEQCAYMFFVVVFRKRPGCALIGACALIKTNAVFFCFWTVCSMGIVYNTCKAKIKLLLNL